MPAGLDENDRTVRLETCVKIIVEPIPNLVTHRLALGLGTALNRVVNNDQARTVTGHSAADTHRSQPAAGGCFPLGLGIGPARGEWEWGICRVRRVWRVWRVWRVGRT